MGKSSTTTRPILSATVRQPADRASTAASRQEFLDASVTSGKSETSTTTGTDGNSVNPNNNKTQEKR